MQTYCIDGVLKGAIRGKNGALVARIGQKGARKGANRSKKGAKRGQKRCVGRLVNKPIGVYVCVAFNAP